MIRRKLRYQKIILRFRKRQAMIARTPWFRYALRASRYMKLSKYMVLVNRRIARKEYGDIISRKQTLINRGLKMIHELNTKYGV